MFIQIKGQSVLPLTDDKMALRRLYLDPAIIVAGSIAILIGIGIGVGEVWLGFWNSVESKAVPYLLLAALVPIGLGYLAIAHEVERRAAKLLKGGFRDICVTSVDWSYGAVLTTPVEENMRFYADYKAKVLQLLCSEELQKADLATHVAESNPTHAAQTWRKAEQGRALQLIASVLHGQFMVDPEFAAVKAAHAALNTK